MSERTWKCRAERWRGTPIIEGTHDSHFFTYGPNGMYTGSCAGYTEPTKEELFQAMPDIRVGNNDGSEMQWKCTRQRVALEARCRGRHRAA